MFTEIEKRDGTIVAFEAQKITNAIAKAGRATGAFDEKIAKRMTWAELLKNHERAGWNSSWTGRLLFTCLLVKPVLRMTS